MTQIIGRKQEKKILSRILSSKEAEFLALYGRRRVGKTHLIREFYRDKGVYFEITGEQNAGLHDQLDSFSNRLSQIFLQGAPIGKLKSWRDAFSLLAQEILRAPKSKPIILFFDELPWLASVRSGFLAALDYFWNQHASQCSHVKLIVCGSAASWMLDNIINAKGGLHNRLTQIMALPPFDLADTKLFLHSRNIRLNEKQILDLYMVMGGIPHYLKQVEKGKTTAQIINTLCFQEGGLLNTEFERLFRALFHDAELNMRIIRQIAKHRYGVSRDHLLKALNLSSGGTFNKRMNELEASGLVRSYLPFGKKKKGLFYRLIDEYSTFYLHWIEPTKKSLGTSKVFWERKAKEPSWKSWAGYAFEEVCFKHLHQIQKALGFEHVSSQAFAWHYSPKTSSENGAQIDLLFDRDDGAVSLCEIKCNQTPYKIDKQEARQLLNKLDVFAKATGTNKQLFLCFITANGLKEGAWSEDLVDAQATLADLFREI